MVRSKRVDGVVQDKPMSERSKKFRVQDKNAENPVLYGECVEIFLYLKSWHDVNTLKFDKSYFPQFQVCK